MNKYDIAKEVYREYLEDKWSRGRPDTNFAFLKYCERNSNKLVSTSKSKKMLLDPDYKPPRQHSSEEPPAPHWSDDPYADMDWGDFEDTH